jgi:hypothetical protein
MRADRWDATPHRGALSKNAHETAEPRRLRPEVLGAPRRTRCGLFRGHRPVNSPASKDMSEIPRTGCPEVGFGRFSGLDGDDSAHVHSHAIVVTWA